jgi:hypothetical protein
MALTMSQGLTARRSGVAGARVQSRAAPRAVARASVRVTAAGDTVMIGLAADSGCGVRARAYAAQRAGGRHGAGERAAPLGARMHRNCMPGSCGPGLTHRAASRRPPPVVAFLARRRRNRRLCDA